MNRAVCESLETRQMLTITLTVTNTAESGNGSLNQAISLANGNFGYANIDFDIPTSDSGYQNGAFTITIVSGFGPLFSNIVIDGSTQISHTGYTNGNRPVIFINGESRAEQAFIAADGADQILDLGIENCVGAGIQTGGALGASALVENCWIGVAPNGTSAAGNGVGIQFAGDATSAGNVIGFNTVGVSEVGVTQDLDYQDYIGVTPTGTAIPNGTGIEITSNNPNAYGGIQNCTNNTIEECEIDYNTGVGVSITGSNASSNVLSSNLIGATTSSGIINYSAGGNGGDGVMISGGAFGNSIQNASGGAMVIADNGGNGVEIDSGTYNSIQAATIGDNTHNGVLISGGSVNSVQECDIGVTYSTSGVSGYFGAGNGGDGILINDGSAFSVIGGTFNGAGNTIAGNSGNGIEFDNASQSVVDANTIGYAVHSIFTKSGITTSYNPNLGYGVYIHDGSASNQIGSTTTNNIISDNSAAGVAFGGDAGTGNSVVDNYIGTDSAGDSIGNAAEGIIDFGSSETITGNVLSGNGHSGISLPGNSNIVSGNYIGINPAGTAALPNVTCGVYINGYSNNVSGNVISGNTSPGVEIIGSTSNTLANNYIGTNAAGTAAIPNQQQGVYVTGTSNLITGDTISGNTGVGVQLNGSSNTVSSCTIGLNAAGTAALSNGNGGIWIFSGGNTIGGITHSNGGNTITSQGAAYSLTDVFVEPSAGSGNTIEGNYIGTNAAGTAALGNTYVGILVGNNDPATYVLTNVVSDCYVGIELEGGTQGNPATSSTVQRNLVGTDVTGSNAVPNTIGIFIGGGATLATIGGSVANQGNTIDYNTQDGVYLSGTTSDGTPTATITGCTIYDNGGVGIGNNGVLSLVNCTITGTVSGAGGPGDGIEDGQYDTLNVYDSTIAENAGTGITGSSTSPLLENTIVAQNTVGDVRTSATGAYNLIGNGTGLSGISNGVNGNQIGTSASPINPQLGTLANNGGATETLLPQSTSPALNAGIGLSTITTDQRGYARPSSGAVDIGAVQHQSNAVSISGLFVYLRLDSTGQTLDVYLNNTGTGTPSQTYALTSISSLSVTGANGNGELTVDYSNGNPTPAGVGISYNGGSGNNTLQVVGTAGSDTIAYNASTVVVGSSTITYSNVATRVVNPLGGADYLSVASGVVVYLPIAPTGGGVVTRTLASVKLSSNAALVVPTSLTRSTDRTLLVIESASIGTGAVLDLGGNDADFTTTPLSTVNSLISSGYNGGSWTGTGIASSFAAANTAHLTALGVIQNNQGGTPLFSSTRLFDGTAPGASDVLVKYTYYGDTNLDGKVDGSDYSRIDNGALNHLTGWFNGDFNYDGIVNGSDYTLIDNAFNTQGATLAAQIGNSDLIAPTSQPAATASNLFSTTEIDPEEKQRRAGLQSLFKVIEGMSESF